MQGEKGGKEARNKGGMDVEWIFRGEGMGNGRDQ